MIINSSNSNTKREYGYSNTPFGLCCISFKDEAIDSFNFVSSTSDYNMNENYSSKQNLYINNKKAKELVSQIFESNKAPDIILKGTPFQIQVWNELSSIPRATTTTYGKIAKAIGQAKSARAVANAIGANPIALLIPCHRVIRSDGSLGGYKWGVNLKRDILQWELDNTKII